MLGIIGHLRAEWDPYLYKSSLEKFHTEEKLRINEDEIKREKYLSEIKALEAQAILTTGSAKEALEKRISNMREHEIHQLSKPIKKPEMFDSRFLIFETDVDTKFSNEDSVKFKYGNYNLVEANFLLKNLVDKGNSVQDLSCN